MNYQPLRDVIVVEVPDGETTTQSGLFVASTPKNQTRGEVRASGPLASEQGIDAGVQVIFVGNILREDREAGKRLLWMTTDNVIGIVRS